MTIRQAGPVQLLEAVERPGQLAPAPAVDDQQTAGAMGMMRAAPPVLMGGGPMMNLTASLQRPDKPGQFIKRLRGTFEIEVSAVRSSPLVIPIEGAAGKTFDHEGRRVVVNSINATPDTGLTVIELSIDDLDELLNSEPTNRPGFGPRGAMMGMQPFMRFGVDPSQSPIQVILSDGRSVPYQTSMDQGSGRITLRVHQPPQFAQVKEIRISSIVASKTKVPFEFHDLPMP